LGLVATACSSGGYHGAHDPGGDAAVPADLGSGRVDDGGAPVDSARPTDSAVVTDSAMPGRDLATPPVDSGPASADPFDPGSCPDAAIGSSQALAMLAGAMRSKLADATLYGRTRTCTGTTPATCGAWTTPTVYQQALLTYSGGVVTDYKPFTFPTHLILFSQAGTPKFSIRHESDYTHDGTADTRGVVFSLGVDPMENTYPVIYVWDFAPKPDRYQDLQGLLGDKGQLHVAQHCARLIFPSGLTQEVAALYTF
jgi:hypothetical protein